MTAHRYWRVLCLKTDGGGVFAIAECGLNTTVGGSTVTGSGTASASDSTFGAASNAFNGNLSDFWATGSSSEQWLEYDFGASNAFDIVEVELWARNDGSDQNQMPAEFILQWSDNNTDWTNAVHCLHTGWTSGQAIKFQVPTFALGATHKHWGLELISVNAGSAFGIAEFEVHDTVSGSSILTGGTASATSDDGTHVPSDAFDGDTSTFWSSNSLTPFLTLRYGALATAQQCAEVAITGVSGTGAGNFCPTAFNVVCSDDGIHWAVEFSEPTVTWTSGVQTTKTFTNPNVAGGSTETGTITQALPGPTQSASGFVAQEAGSITQSLPAPTQAGALFKPGAAGTGLRQFGTFGG